MIDRRLVCSALDPDKENELELPVYTLGDRAYCGQLLKDPGFEQPYEFGLPGNTFHFHHCFHFHLESLSCPI